MKAANFVNVLLALALVILCASRASMPGHRTEAGGNGGTEAANAPSAESSEDRPEDEDEEEEKEPTVPGAPNTGSSAEASVITSISGAIISLLFLTSVAGVIYAAYKPRMRF